MQAMVGKVNLAVVMETVVDHLFATTRQDVGLFAVQLAGETITATEGLLTLSLYGSTATLIG